MDHNVETKTSKRGVFLWIMLANSILVSLARLMTLLFSATFSYIYVGGPTWGYGANLFAFIVEVIGIIGVINWKKWGVYLVIIIDLVEIVIDRIYFAPRLSTEAGLVLDVIAIGLFVWAVKRKWSYFQ